MSSNFRGMVFSLQDLQYWSNRLDKHIDEFLDFVRIAKDARILDVAAGTGFAGQKVGMVSGGSNGGGLIRIAPQFFRFEIQISQNVAVSGVGVPPTRLAPPENPGSATDGCMGTTAVSS